MQIDHLQKRNVSPEQVVSLLNKQGITISPEDAETVVNFLYFLAEIIASERNEE